MASVAAVQPDARGGTAHHRFQRTTKPGRSGL